MDHYKWKACPIALSFFVVCSYVAMMGL